MTDAGRIWDGRRADELGDRWKVPVTALASVGSTNDEAKRLAEDEDAPAGAIVVAEEQTAGRGRGNRKWSSPPGGLYVSMVFRPAALDPAPVSVVAGLGIARALDRAFAELQPSIKWPNDLYASGLKFGGVLSEASWAATRPRRLVVGVGINVRPLDEDSYSREIRRNSTSIDEETERTVPLVEVADAVIAGLRERLLDPRPRLATADLDDLDRYDAMREARGTLVPPGDAEPLPGKCVGIAPDGALLFRPDRGALQRVTEGSLIPE